MAMRLSIVRRQIFPLPSKLLTWVLREIRYFFN